MRLIRIYLSDLKELLQEREFVSLRTALKQISPMDLAEGWEFFTTDERKAIFRLMPSQGSVQLFEELDPDFQEELLTGLETKDVKELVEDLDPGETSRVLRELPEPVVNQLESILDKMKQGEQVERYMRYPDESVGALMRSNYISVDPRWTCRQALDGVCVRVPLKEIETAFLDTLYITDKGDKLLGTVRLKELVVAPPAMKVVDLMNKDPVTLPPEADQEEATRLFTHYNLTSMPVVSPDRTLLGILVDHDIDDVVEEETEEDFAKMAGVAAGEFEAKTAWESAWHRMPWLGITCLGQLVVALVIRGFEDTLQKMVALATFIPLIAAMGGNIGAQSAIIVVRELSTGEIEKTGSKETVLRDMKVGLLLGLVGSLLLMIAAHVFYGHRPEFGWGFSIVTGMGILVSMSFAATVGAIVPLVFDRVGIDPATATGPLVTTLTDILGIAAYLALASYLLFF